MFKNLKKTIMEAAHTAVLEAETLFGSNNGKLKKEAAVAFVTSAIPAPAWLKPILSAVLHVLIDESVEAAVAILKVKTVL